MIKSLLNKQFLGVVAQQVLATQQQVLVRYIASSSSLFCCSGQQSKIKSLLELRFRYCEATRVSRLQCTLQLVSKGVGFFALRSRSSTYQHLLPLAGQLRRQQIQRTQNNQSKPALACRALAEHLPSTCCRSLYYFCLPWFVVTRHAGVTTLYLQVTEVANQCISKHQLLLSSSKRELVLKRQPLTSSFFINQYC